MSSTKTEQFTGNEIAIIGMAGCFPKAKNIQEFWHNLCEGVEGITFFSKEELASSGIPLTALDDPRFVRANGMLKDVEMFDASFFGYSPREAELIDPQQRFFLEHAWQALEAAGYDAQTYEKLIGVYAGLSMNTYFSYLLHAMFQNPQLGASVDSLQLTIANDKDFLATRVSYKLGLHGPSIVVQTACSTSLVAVHLACQGLLNFECDMALAGGVSIQGPQKSGYYYQEGKISSPDGHCRTFDMNAQGCVPGNGVGIVVLKRLSEALVDGDSIHAVIKGTACNNDGAAKIGYTAPSTQGQARVIAEAQSIAGVHPETITYIEAHGTATPLGDPIEITALTQAFRLQTNKKGFCAIGSVKTNIGHLNAAAGIAGLIKTALALEHRVLPPNLHFATPNAQIDFANSPFYVNNTLSTWEQHATPRRAGVSSFGIGGTNAHVVLEEAPSRPQTTASPRTGHLLVLSAKTETALQRAHSNLLEHIQQHPELDLVDIAYTLQVGRRTFNHRMAVVCQDRTDAIHVLATADPARILRAVEEAEQRPVVFMFPGQGSQYVHMGRELYLTEPVFHTEIDRCVRLLTPYLAVDLRQILYPEGDSADKAIVQLQQTWLTQPALFVIEYALAKLWESWGVHPIAMIGHSIGEYVAACLAGVFTLEEALKLVAVRGRLMQELPYGAMLAISGTEVEVQRYLRILAERGEGPLSIAAINSPTQCVASGSIQAIGALERLLQASQIPCQYVQTSHAFHSAMVEPVLQAFEKQINAVALHEPQIRYISNITGTWVTPSQATSPQYWVQHLRQAVRFADGIEELLCEPDWVFLEVGPGRNLNTFVKQTMHARGLPTTQPLISSLRRAKDTHSDSNFLLTSTGRLWLAGVTFAWPKLYAHEIRQRVPLPTYPFERQRYWFDALSPVASEHQQTRTSQEPKIQASVAVHYPRPNLPTAYIAPRNSLEQKLATIWGELLGIDQVGIYDNFFDLGGHSLLATQVVSRLRATVQAEVPLGDLFEKPTIAELAEVILQSQEEGNDRIAPAALRAKEAQGKQFFPLSFAQQRLWFLDRLEPMNAFYNLPMALRFSGTLNVTALEQSLAEVIRRHEILRTTFDTIDGETVQIVHPARNFTLKMLDLSGLSLSERDEEASRLARQEAQYPFDLMIGPLLRGALMRLEKGEYALLLTMHHIITDAWSNGIFMREIATLYRSFVYKEPSPLAELPIQYADFAVWQRQRLQGEHLENLLRYWKKDLRGLSPLQLPTDRPRPAVQSYRGAAETFTLSSELSEALAILSKQEGVTLFMTLLAAFQTLLYSHTVQSDIAVGTDIANRTRVETEALIGFFVNVLVLRSNFSDKPTFRNLLSRVRETVLGAYTHQDLPFEMLVNIVRPDRAMDRVPLAQVLFVLQNAPIARATWPDLTLRPGHAGVQTSRFDLAIFMHESPEGLRGSFIYSTDLFDGATIKRLADCFRTLLQHIIEQPDNGVDALELYTEAQKQQRFTQKQARRVSNIRELLQTKEEEISLYDIFQDNSGV